ncbi:sensor histidine kinase [Flagellimonas sp. S174]|uniref:sensor histidine kinase n=1 Tax=Flagellimonas sp. S174 TaxID=3410790 RepID=UPI003BF57E1F
MHSLLKRQIRKHLPEDLKENPALDALFNAISNSYSNFDEKITMIQRATSLSSLELFEANERLNKEAETQRKVLKSLSKAVADVQHQNGSDSATSFDPLKLVEDIEEQAQKLVTITAEKDVLLQNLEQQNESLNNYAHMVSHDLKSPIRNVHSLVSWVFEEGKEQFNTQSHANVDLIFQNLTKMDSLIDGILKHSTIDSLQEQPVLVDLYELVEEIEDTIYVPASVHIKKSRMLPRLYTGKYRMEQLFKNVITNAVAAVEENKSGLIVVDVKEEKGKWMFSITDNGKGIPEHLQAGIFDMFRKLENNSDATGIGLALVKKIINYYKGDIWLSSEEGSGTTFFFTINKDLDYGTPKS